MVATGLLLVLSTLGARWSQVQWLMGALSVGIAFPQRDLHLDTIKPPRVQVEPAGLTNA